MTIDTTRNKIISAASTVFTEKGFEQSTIRDICNEAGANVAAVNYHFGDKRTLYYEVMRMWMAEFVEKAEYKRGLPENPTPQQRLWGYIHAELAALCSYRDESMTDIRRVRLMIREITDEDHDPTVFDCHQEFEEKVLYPIIRDIVGPVDREALFQCHIAATGMITHYFIMAIHNPIESLDSEDKHNQLTDFLTTFILGGLQAIKEQHNV